MQKSFLFIFVIFFMSQVFADDAFCGNVNSSMEVCVKTDSTGHYAIFWSDKSLGQETLPIYSRIVSPIDGSITFTGYINWHYPFESYSLVVDVNSTKDENIPATFTYAKTYMRAEVYSFPMKAVN